MFAHNLVSCSPGEETNHHPQAQQSHIHLVHQQPPQNTSMTDVFTHSLIIFAPQNTHSALLDTYRLIQEPSRTVKLYLKE